MTCPSCNRRYNGPFAGRESWGWEWVGFWLYGWEMTLYSCRCGAQWSSAPRKVRAIIVGGT